MDTGQSSLTRTPACSLLSTALSVDTTSSNFPLAWSAPKTSSRKRWTRSSKNAKDASESQMTSPYMATQRQNMMPAYEISCVSPANMTWCSIHRKHMWRPKPSISLDAYTMPVVSTQTLERLMLYTPCQHPPNITELQEFLGLVTYLSPFIPGPSTLDCPSTRAAQEGCRLQLEPYLWHCFWADQGSCHQWHHPQVLQPITTHDNPSWCLTGSLGAALLQNGKPVAFASKALTETECQYVNIEREMLVAVFRAERFHTYIYGWSFMIKSDHKPLESISRKKPSRHSCMATMHDVMPTGIQLYNLLLPR